jgi:hypothetical protein
MQQAQWQLKMGGIARQFTALNNESALECIKPQQRWFKLNLEKET